MGKRGTRRSRGIVQRHQPVVGSPPGVLEPNIDANAPVVRVMRYSATDLEERDRPDLGTVREMVHGTGVTWIDVVGIEDTEWLKKLGEILGIHPLAIEDIAHSPQRPKADEYENGLFLVLKMPDPSSGLEQVCMFVGPGFVATFQERGGDCFEAIRRRARNTGSRLRRRGADYLGFAIVDAIVDSYFPVVEHIGTNLDRLEERLTDPSLPTTGVEIQAQRREVLRLQREVAPLRETIHGFLVEDAGIVQEATRPYLRDCEDHVAQLLEDLDTCREMSAALMDRQISNSSQKLNEVMKVLTIISTIFIPLSFIAGLYGMNFDGNASALNMPELRWTFGYPAVLLVMLAVAGSLLIFFRRRGWLGGGNRKDRNSSDET